MKRKPATSGVNSDQAKSDYLEVRLGAAEKLAFKQAAELAGLALSAWVRERLRMAARKELADMDRPIPFLG